MQSYGNLPNWQIFLAAFTIFNSPTNKPLAKPDIIFNYMGSDIYHPTIFNHCSNKNVICYHIKYQSKT